MNQKKYMKYAVGFTSLVALVILTLNFIPILYAASASPSPSSSSSSSKKSTSEKRVNTMEKYLKKLNQFNTLKGEEEQKALEKFTQELNRAVPEGQRCLSSEDKSTCKDQITQSYKLTHNLYRLIKYYQLKAGKKNICVKADMGVEKYLKAKGISNPKIFYLLATGAAKVNPDNPKETGRTKSSTVFLCNDGNGTKKLRIQAANGKYVKLTPEDLARPELKIENLPPMENIQRLKEKVGL